MLLAELEVWHTRPRMSTRRVALGHMILPIEPPPGFGGLLLAAIVAAHLPEVDGDLHADVATLVRQVVAGQRVVQPRLAHRYQVDRHGLAVSRHRLVAVDDRVNVDLGTVGSPLAQVLGAVYAIERLDPVLRTDLAATINRAMRWKGSIGPSFIAEMTGAAPSRLVTRANPQAWARSVFGFDGPAPEGPDIDRRLVMRRYRERLRDIHPDLGGDRRHAAEEIESLSEARRILLDELD